MTDLDAINTGLLLSSLRDFKDEHSQEMLKRAHTYTANRIAQGQVVDENGVRATFGAFADGFCTGFHRGSGTVCPRG